MCRIKTGLKTCNSTVSYDRNATGSSEFSVIVWTVWQYLLTERTAGDGSTLLVLLLRTTLDVRLALMVIPSELWSRIWFRQTQNDGFASKEFQWLLICLAAWTLCGHVWRMDVHVTDRSRCDKFNRSPANVRSCKKHVICDRRYRELWCGLSGHH